MHVKNHTAMWSLWFLWFLWVEYSGNPLYKPLCAFLVFVDLVWFLCGQLCGFWSCVVFGSCLARPIHLLWSLWFGGLALDADACPWSCASTCPQGLRVRSTSCGFGGSMVLPSMPMPMLMLMLMIARPLARRSLWICGLARPLARRACPQGLRVRLRVLLLFVVRWSCASTCPQGLRGFWHLPAGLARPLDSPTAKRPRSNCKRWLGRPPLVVPTKRRDRASSAWRPSHSIPIA